jgi:hypothetical protein
MNPKKLDIQTKQPAWIVTAVLTRIVGDQKA